MKCYRCLRALASALTPYCESCLDALAERLGEVVRELYPDAAGAE